MISMRLLNVVLIFAVCVFVQQMPLYRTTNGCLLSRLDVLPCSNPRVTQPGENQYAIYQTRFRRDSRGLPYCRIRKRGEIIRDIDVSGAVKLLYSPGMEILPRVNYFNQMLVDYHIKCSPGEVAFISVVSIDMEPMNCFDQLSDQHKCQDYVQVDGGSTGVFEFCGSDSTGTSHLVPTDQFHVRMRSSRYGRYPGFMGYVVCFAQQRVKGSCTAAVPSKLSAARQPAGSITAAEINILDNVVTPLFDAAFSDARKKGYQWPPDPSYFEDVRDIYESLSTDSFTIHFYDLEDVFLDDDLVPVQPVHPILPIDDKPYLPLPVDPIQHLQKRALNLKSGVTELAARISLFNEDSCSQVVQAAAKSYLTVAKQLNPIELSSIRLEVEHERVNHLQYQLSPQEVEH